MANLSLQPTSRLSGSVGRRNLGLEGGLGKSFHFSISNKKNISIFFHARSLNSDWPLKIDSLFLVTCLLRTDHPYHTKKSCMAPLLFVGGLLGVAVAIFLVKRYLEQHPVEEEYEQDGEQRTKIRHGNL